MGANRFPYIGFMWPGWKRLIKHALAVAVYYSGSHRLILTRRRRSGEDPGYSILMYHRVLEPHDPALRYTQSGLFVTPESFKKQLRFLADKYRIVPLGQLVAELRAGQRPKAHTVVITFDDGWRDNYEHGLPALAASRLPATVFVAGGLVGTDKALWFLKIGALWANGLAPDSVVTRVAQAARTDRASLPQLRTDDLDGLLEFLKALEPDLIERIADDLLEAAPSVKELLARQRYVLNWDEIGEMLRAGIEFGSHGQSHRVLTFLKEADVSQELSESKALLEARLGRPITLLAYPNGSCNERVKELARESGYVAAVSADPRRTGSPDGDLYELGRTGVHEGVTRGFTGRFSRALFACALHRVFPFK